MVALGIPEKTLALSSLFLHQVFVHIDKIPLVTSLLQAEQSQPLLIGEMPQSLKHFCGPSLDTHLCLAQPSPPPPTP